MTKKRAAKTNYFWILLSILLVMLLLYSFEEPWQNQTRRNATTTQSSPDWFMKEMTAKSFDSTGKLKGDMRSPYIAHTINDNIINITTPIAHMYDKSGNTWLIQAMNARAFQANPEHVFLQNQVNIKELAGTNSDNILIQTDYLTYYSSTQIAVTDAPVTVKQPNNILHAVGANANFETGDIKFLSHIEVEYDNVDQETQKP